MRRVLLVLGAALIMSAMIAASAVPAFAEANERNKGNGSDAPGQDTASDKCSDAYERQEDGGVLGGHKQEEDAPANCDHFFDPKDGP